MKNKPKKIIPLLLLLLSFAAHSGLAQSENPPKWEIGTDLLFLFDKNQLPDYSLFATRKLGDKGYALRSRVGFDMTFVYPRTVSDSPFYSNGQRYNYLAMAGLEKEFSKLNPTKGTKVYWAVDFAFSQSIQNNQAKAFQQGLDTVFVVQKSRDNIYAIAGSIGVKQTITPSISIRLESSLSFNLASHRSEYFDLFLDSNSPTDRKDLISQTKSNPDSYTEYIGQSEGIRIVPFSQLLLTIKF